MGQLDGKVAFITGAARGQGRAHAVTLAREGARIAVLDICAQVEGVEYPMATPEDLAETARQVEALGQPCLTFQVDARDGAAVRAAADRTAAELGGIDVGVINHGILIIGSWESTTDAQWDALIETNLSAVWRSARAVIPHLVRRGGGSLVLTSSSTGLKPSYGLMGYGAAKHGVIGLARSLAVELGPQSVRVNAICPGSIDTPMVDNQHLYDLFNGGPGGTRESMDFPTRAVQALPVAWMEPEAVSEAVVYLASDAARYVTGVALPVDAGTTTMPSGIPPMAATRLAELEARLHVS